MDGGGTRRRMVAEFDASIEPFKVKLAEMQAALDAMERGTADGFDNIDANADQAVGSIDRLKSAIVGIGSSAVVAAFLNLADQGKAVENQLRAIGGGADDTRLKVYQLAIETRSPIDATVALLRTMQKSLSTQTLDKTIQQVGTLNRLMVIGGLDGGARASVSLQFGQALQSGVLAGDELRALREAAPAELLDAIAKAAGGTTADLRKLGSEGKLTRDVMVKALDDLSQVAKDKFGDFSMSIADGFTILQTGLIATTTEIDKSIGATNLVAQVQAKLGQFLLNNVSTLTAFSGAMRVVFDAALALAGVAGFVGVFKSVQLLTGGLAGLRTAFAFFGGPLSLAIAAAGFVMLEVARNTRTVTDRVQELNSAMADYKASITSLDGVNADLQSAHEDLIDASDRYKAALAREGPAAQAAAALEISSINDRIAALDLLRQAKLSDARLANANALRAATEVQDALTAQVARSVVASRSDQIHDELTKAGKPDDGAASDQAQAELANGQLNDAISAAMKEKITSIRERLITNPGSVTSDEADFIAAMNTLDAASANVQLLAPALKLAEEAGVSAGAAVTRAFSLTDVNNAVDKLKQELSSVDDQIANLRTALASKGAADGILPVTGYEGGAPVSPNRAEAAAALAELEARREKLIEATAAAKSLADAEATITAVMQSGTLTMAEARTKLADLVEARKALVATYGAESSQVAAADAAMARITGQMRNAEAAANGLRGALVSVSAVLASLGNANVQVEDRLAGARATLAALQSGVAANRAQALGAAETDTRAGMRAIRAEYGRDDAGAPAIAELQALKTQSVETNTALSDTNDQIAKLLTPPSSGGGSGAAGSGAVSALEGLTAQVKDLNEAEQIAVQLIDAQRTPAENAARETQKYVEARALLVAKYGEEAAIVQQLDAATKRLKDTANQTYAQMAQDMATAVVQGGKLEDILASIVVQLLQTNGANAFQGLFSGGGLTSFFTTLVGGTPAAGVPGATPPPARPASMALAARQSIAKDTGDEAARLSLAKIATPDGGLMGLSLSEPNLAALERIARQPPPNAFAGGVPEVHIHETNQEQTTKKYDPGSGRLDVFMRKSIGEMIDGGQLDGPMKRRFGQTPRVR